MKKLTLLSIIMLFNMTTLGVNSNDDANQKAAIKGFGSIIPGVTPLRLIHEGWYTNSRDKLETIKEGLVMTSFKSSVAAVTSANISYHPKFLHLSKTILFLDAHAFAIVPAALGCIFVNAKYRECSK